MLRKDGTGPHGRGTMSGRGMFFCVKEIEEDSPNMQNEFMRERKFWSGRGRCRFRNHSNLEEETANREIRRVLLNRLYQK
ncbi:MAG: DUF5320 domain-containing protein [Synergistaceae bacterium]|nr:DUF5320 domain-containing protein [Synergistaceae bacterium]